MEQAITEIKGERLSYSTIEAALFLSIQKNASSSILDMSDGDDSYIFSKTERLSAKLRCSLVSATYTAHITTLAHIFIKKFIYKYS